MSESCLCLCLFSVRLCVCARARAHPGKRLPYLAALTADATEGVEGRCALAGFHQVLNKPAGMEALQGALQAMAAFHLAAGAGAG